MVEESLRQSTALKIKLFQLRFPEAYANICMIYDFKILKKRLTNRTAGATLITNKGQTDEKE